MKSSYTRKELYDLVWSIPMIRLAKQLNYSDNGLRKICRKHDIPIPKAGYWQKLKYHKEVEIIPLPVSKIHSTDMVGIGREITDDNINMALLTQEQRLKMHLQTLLEKSKPQPKKDHQIVETVKWKYLGNAAPRFQRNYPLGKRVDSMEVDVFPKSFSRAAKITNRFLWILEATGFEYFVDHRGLVVRFLEQDVVLKIREITNRVKRKDTWGSDFISTGKLAIKHVKPYSNVEWKDGRKALEDQLLDVVIYIHMYAYKKKRENIRMRYYWQQQKVKDIEKQERKRKADWKKEQFRMLISDAEQYAQFIQMSSFIEHIKQEVQSENELYFRWLGWAEKQLEAIDPLSHGLAEYLNKYEYNE